MTVLHVDLDQFIAAVEILRRPALRGLPVVVGGAGDPTQRGVVATASYEARARGVHSGLPMKTAFKRCPEAVFLPADRDAYEAASAAVMAALRSSGLVVECLGWDEAFVAAPAAPAVSAASADDPRAAAVDLQRRVFEATSLHCTVGIGQNKLQAKMATGFGKPAGVFEIQPEDWLPLFGDKPTSVIWGIGPRIARRLAELDIHTVAQLATAPPSSLVPHFGPSTGPWIAALGRGAVDSPVSDSPRVAVSRSREETFQTDLTSWPDVAAAVDSLARALMETVVADGRSVMRVFVKVRFVPFTTKTKGRKLPEPTSSADVVAACALELLNTFPTHRAVRLLGVRTEFTPLAGSP